MLQIFKKQKQSLKYLHVQLQKRARQRLKQNLPEYISSNRTYRKIDHIYVNSVSQSVCNLGYIFYNFVSEINCLVSDLVAVFLVTTAASGSPERKKNIIYHFSQTKTLYENLFLHFLNLHSFSYFAAVLLNSSRLILPGTSCKDFNNQQREY